MHPLAHRVALKMNGLGNEIVVLDARDGVRVSGPDARAIGRVPGLGFDQLMVIEPPDDPIHDARLAIYNIDGSRAEACGNGTRCVAAALAREGDRARFRFESDGGLLDVRRDSDDAITVDMGPPRFGWADIPLAAPTDTARVALSPAVPGVPDTFVAVSMGNPHAVFFVPDAEAIDLERVGPRVERHPMFPARVNASFAQRLAADAVRLRVWERGAGATRACGTAACATLVAGARTGMTAREATITLPGGDLRVAWRGEDGHVLMTGPATFEFERALDPALLSDAPRVTGVAGAGPQVVTLGCRLNIVESEAMGRHAAAAGFLRAPVVNTCAVTGDAERKSRAAVRRALRDAPDGPVFVTGCAAAVAPRAFAALSPRVTLVGNDRKAGAQTWKTLAAERGVPAPAAAAADQRSAPAHTRAFVAVQNGCDHRCTFCVIPFGRGASRSVPASDVVERVRAQIAAGHADVVLTGVDLTAWGLDLGGGERLGDLVRAVLRGVPHLPRLRLSSLDCMEADPALLDAIAHEERLMPHLHLSLQAGDDLVLKRMKRRHTRDEAVRFCADLRRRRSDLVLGADLIAGFPTESDDAFARTLALPVDCGLTHLHVFPYSPRPGTPAARMPAVPPSVVAERAARLRAEGARRLAAHLDAQVGRHLTVLAERGGVGRAADFTAVALPGDLAPGRFAQVAIAGHDGTRLRARGRSEPDGARV